MIQFSIKESNKLLFTFEPTFSIAHLISRLRDESGGFATTPTKGRERERERDVDMEIPRIDKKQLLPTSY